MLIDPLGIGGVSPNTSPTTKSTASTELAVIEAPVEQLLVQPDNWESWTAQRDLLHGDKPESPAISAYQQVANAPLRDHLQQLVGVDLYV